MPSGSCMCGQIHWSATGEPIQKAICHCLTCRRLSGSTHTTNILFPEDRFRYTAGSPKSYAAKQDSGMTLTYSFCGNCGVTLSKVGDAEAFKGVVIVQAGTMNEGEDFEGMAAPEVELYTKERVGWLPALEGRGQMREFS